MRRFENGAKFWDVTLDGTNVALRFGDATRESALTRTFASEAEAVAYIDKQVALQLGRGYVEIELAPPPPVAKPIAATDPAFADGAYALERARRFTRDDEILQIEQRDRTVTITRDGEPAAREYASVEAASAKYVAQCEDTPRFVEIAAEWHIRANPALEARCRESGDAWSTYADWLITQRDPRGEIAARHLASAPVAKLIERWFPDFPPEIYAFELEHGFVAAVKITAPEHWERRKPIAGYFARFASSPLAAFATRVELGPDWVDNSWTRAIAAIGASPLAPRLRELALRAHHDWHGEDRDDNHVGRTEWSAFENLETLTLSGIISGHVGELALPELRELRIISNRLDYLADIAASPLRRLERLELWFGGARRRTDELRDLDTILAGKRLPKLRHLGLVERSGLDQLVARLATSPLLARLDSLDLRFGRMTAAGARVVVEHAERFGHLAAFDLSHNSLNAAASAALRGALPNVNVADQGTLRDGQDDDRYDADEE